MVKRTTMSVQSVSEAQMAESRYPLNSKQSDSDLNQPLMGGPDEVSFSFRAGGPNPLKFG